MAEHSLIKRCQNWTFKMSKIVQIFLLFLMKNESLGAQFLLKLFFYNFNFKTPLFGVMNHFVGALKYIQWQTGIPLELWLSLNLIISWFFSEWKGSFHRGKVNKTDAKSKAFCNIHFIHTWNRKNSICYKKLQQHAAVAYQINNSSAAYFILSSEKNSYFW